MGFLFDFVFHIEQYLSNPDQTFGFYFYLLLFGVMFFETALVLTALVPGNNVMFLLGVLASFGKVNVVWMFFVLFLAIYFGDVVNYWIGSRFGKFFRRKNYFKKEHMDAARHSYTKYGVEILLLAKFLPFVKALVPILAGTGFVKFRKFLGVSAVAALLWIVVFFLGGYFFGGINAVKENIGLFTIILGLLSFGALAFSVVKFVKEYNSGG